MASARKRPSLLAALALAVTLGTGNAPAGTPAQLTGEPLKQAALLTDRAAQALMRKVRKRPEWGWQPRKDKGYVNGRGDWLSQKTVDRKQLEAQFGPLSGRQLKRIRKARRRLENPATDLRTKIWSLRVFKSALSRAVRRVA